MGLTAWPLRVPSWPTRIIKLAWVGTCTDNADIHDATAELRSAGMEVLLEPEVDDSGNAWVHSPGGLEQFDQVAGGVLQQGLRAAGSADDVVAEPAAGGA
jgi:hypothetical protein